MDRVILHCDLNNFFASVECLYNPEIRDKPVAVCGSQGERRGIVLAKNYLAKAYGVATAEPIWQAKQKCPNLITVPPTFRLYNRFSKEARNIYNNYTDLIESFGIDECWLDLTGSVKDINCAEKIAYQIKERIKNELGLTISVGVSFNKIFAKLGSDMKKPDAVTVITRENFKNKIWSLPVEELLYVGRQTKKKLNKISIYTIGDLAKCNLHYITGLLGKNGGMLWSFANGYDISPVTSIDYQSTAKGIGNSTTSPKDLICNDEIKILFCILAESVGERLRTFNLKGRTLQIMIRDNNMDYLERQGKLDVPSYSSTEILNKALELFMRWWDWNLPVRALGIRMTDLSPGDQFIQMCFLPNDKRQKCELIDHCIDNIRSRFGHDAIQRAVILTDNCLKPRTINHDAVYSLPYAKGGNLK